MRYKRKLLIGGLVLLLGTMVFWAALKYHAWKYQSTSSVLREMQDYQAAHRYDDAISVGTKFTERFPGNGFNDRVYAQIAILYLQKAEEGNGRSDHDVASALAYRDKILPIAADTDAGWYSANAFRNATIISEKAGDLSEPRRCEQYRTALQLTRQFIRQVEVQQQRVSNLNSDKDEFGYTTEHVQLSLQESKQAIARIGDKQRKAGCP